MPCLVIMSDLFAVLAGGAFMLLSTKMTFLMYLRAAADAIVYAISLQASLRV